MMDGLLIYVAFRELPVITLNSFLKILFLLFKWRNVPAYE